MYLSKTFISKTGVYISFQRHSVFGIPHSFPMLQVTCWCHLPYLLLAWLPAFKSSLYAAAVSGRFRPCFCESISKFAEMIWRGNWRRWWRFWSQPAPFRGFANAFCAPRLHYWIGYWRIPHLFCVAGCACGFGAWLLSCYQRIGCSTDALPERVVAFPTPILRRGMCV